MTKEDIIRMAREAGIEAEADTLCRYEGFVEPLERFAALVIANNPPQRTWVGLTAKEKHEFRYSHMTTADFIEAIEAKLKDKNTRGQEWITPNI